jgi:hypothetical protein
MNAQVEQHNPSQPTGGDGGETMAARRGRTRLVDERLRIGAGSAQPVSVEPVLKPGHGQLLTKLPRSAAIGCIGFVI